MAVYLIQAGEGGAVKIGRTVDVAKRIRSLQTSQHCKLVLRRLLKGNGELEKVLHRQFSSQRVTGEWFSLTEEQINLCFGVQDLPLAIAEHRIRFTPTRYPLLQYLRDYEFTLESFGLLIPAAAESVRRWADGGRFPHPDMIDRIEQVTNGEITANDFMVTRRIRASLAKNKEAA